MCILKVLYQILNPDAHKVVIKLSYFYFAGALVDHRLWLHGTKFKQLQFINVFNFKMSTKALTGWYFVLAKSGLYSVKTGLKGFELPIPRPSTVTNVVVELNWKSRKNKKDDKQYFGTQIVFQYCHTISGWPISAFDFQNVLIFKVH